MISLIANLLVPWVLIVVIICICIKFDKLQYFLCDHVILLKWLGKKMIWLICRLMQLFLIVADMTLTNAMVNQEIFEPVFAALYITSYVVIYLLEVYVIPAQDTTPREVMYFEASCPWLFAPPPSLPLHQNEKMHETVADLPQRARVYTPHNDPLILLEGGFPV